VTNPLALIFTAVVALAVGSSFLAPPAAPAPVQTIPFGFEDDPTAGATYVGEAGCKKCHFKQHKTWKAMKHASAWDVLDEEYRTLSAKDDSGRACLSCHVTGWGQEDRGGFVDPETSAHLLGVQCETCHGPGSAHEELGRAMLKEKRKEFHPGESSLQILTPRNCANCHNPHYNHDDMGGDH
jgi:hypothetical protein